MDLSGHTNLRRLSGYVFDGCTSLTSVDLSGCTNINIIDNSVFEGCTSLTSVDLSGCTGLETINMHAFEGCTSLTTVDFSGCTNLKTIDNSVFQRCTGLTTMDLSGCTGLEIIKSTAFNWCTSLTTVVLPSGLREIESNVFLNCSNLQTLTILAETPPDYGGGVFDGCSSIKTINVPAGSEGSYKGSYGWSDYSDIITGKNLFFTPVSPSWSGQYDSAFDSKTFTITNVSEEQISVSVTLGGDHSDKFTLSEEEITVDANSTATFTVTPVTGLDLGTYEATVTVETTVGDSEVTETTDISFNVNRRSLAGAGVQVSGSYTYDGNEQKPDYDAVSVTLGGKTLTAGDDYTLTYSHNTNAGTARVIITGTGKYTGSAKGTFTIAQAAPTVSDVKVSGPATIYSFTDLSTITLTHAYDDTPGTLTLTAGQTLTVGENSYNWTFTPDGSNYATVTGSITLTVSATPQQIGGVYQIETADDLFCFAALVNGTLEEAEQDAAANAVMTNDITIPEGKNWTPIGNASTIYTGTFDGAGHTISGMKIENAESYSGLFGNVTGTVKNFTIDGSITVNTTATDVRVGGAVGSIGTTSAAGTVSGVTCDVDITVTSGSGHIGGVVGSMIGDMEPTVENCVYTGNIKYSADADCVAGVVAYIRSGYILNCANRGTVSVSGSGGNVGGVLGYGNNAEIYIHNCYNTGTVTGGSDDAKVGAIIGQDNGNQADITNCYYLTDSADKGQGQLDADDKDAVVMSADDFKSGAVCWLLNGFTGENVSWYQTLGESGDLYPVLDSSHGTVYYGTNCKQETLYSNSPVSDKHSYENGFCTVCNRYQPAEKNENGVYEISNAGQLFWFAALVNGDNTHAEFAEQDKSASAVLTNDITIPGDESGTYNWTPIGNYRKGDDYNDAIDHKYTGTFDGAGHTISGMIIKNVEYTECSYWGFVGYLDKEGTIRNLTMGKTCNVIGNNSMGCICGYKTGTIENCVNTGTVIGDYYVSGICADSDGGIIKNCANYGTVRGNSNVGGICGWDGGTKTNCVNYGIVSGDSNVGGICGYNVGNCINCYWLYGTCAAGVDGGKKDNVVVKSADEFKSGEVAYLLQGDQTELVWGQAIGTDEYPVLTTDEAKKVYAYSIYKGNSTAEPGYANDGAAAISLEGNAVAVVETAGFTVADDKANVIVKDGDGAYTCGSLVLTDGADFYTPVAFTATKATYSRTLPETSTWGTIALPFAAEVSGASLYQADGVVSGSGEESILAVIPTVGNTLDANTPALFKGERAGAEVSFSATGAEVAATADAGLTKAIGEGYSLNGSMSTITLNEGDLFISKDMFWSVGTQNTVGMQAFRAYIDAPSSSPAKSMRIMVGSTSDIRQAVSGGSRLVDVYSLQGIMLRKGVESGKALNGLPSGVYVVDGKKVMF